MENGHMGIPKKKTCRVGQINNMILAYKLIYLRRIRRTNNNTIWTLLAQIHSWAIIHVVGCF